MFISQIFEMNFLRNKISYEIVLFHIVDMFLT